jgi:hypothetical protein
MMKKPMHLRFLKIVGILSAALILLLSVGFTYATIQERQDSFCISCHTQPETDFYQRSVGQGQAAAAPVDLASDHKPKAVLCIDCHDGSGLGGHIQAVELGARNTVIFYTGTAEQPARLTVPIRDDACLKCHRSTVERLERNNHQHTLLATWQASDPHAAGCTTCHTAHTTDGPALHGFLNGERSQVVCDACHRAIRDVP